MSKRFNIRWSESDNQELRRAVKNFNAKISRLEKKNPDIKTALPDRVSVKQMRELIDTRQDLKRELNALRRFSKRGAEELTKIPDNDYNVTITKWQKNEMSRRAAVINRKRKQRREQLYNMPATSRGEELGYTVGQKMEAIGMGRADERALDPIRPFTKKMNRRDLKKKFDVIMKESQSSYWKQKELQMMENFKQAITENFNPEDVKDVVEAIDQMDFDQFYQIYLSEGSDFETAYPPDAEQYDAYLSALKATWIPNMEE